MMNDKPMQADRNPFLAMMARLKDVAGLPFWRGRPTRMRHSRTPFGSTRKRIYHPNQMQVEGFRDKDTRDARFRELRAQKTPHVSRYSTYDGGKSLWCVVYK